MDTLSTLLAGTRVHARVTNTATVRAPWGLARDGAHRAVFHAVVEGRCFLAVDGRSVPLERGHAVLLPQGSAHALTDHPDTPPSPLRMCPALDEMAVPDLAVDGAGPTCRLVCGLIALEGPIARTTLDALGTCLVLDGQADDGLALVLGQLAREAFDARPGAAAILDELARLLFLYALRHAVHQTGVGLLAALADPRLRRAIRAVHEQPGEPWDLPRLASVASMSRSSFARAFADSVGATPGAYVRQLRLQLVGERLRTTSDGLDQIAGDVGYSSAAALSRAFKSHHGISPRAWKSRRSGA